MPVVNLDLVDLKALIGDSDLDTDHLVDRLPMIGADVEKVEDGVLVVEFFPDRCDLFSIEGVARAMRAFLGRETGLTEYEVHAGEKKLIVEESVLDIRRHILSGFVSGLTVDDFFIRSIIEMQEKLHFGIGRDRKKMSVGLHDAHGLEFPVRYYGCEWDGIRFLPLHADELDITEPMTPAEIIRPVEEGGHPKGAAYAHLVDGLPRVPMLVDARDEVLSFPPIINGTLTTITEETTDIFIDITGPNLDACRRALNIIATALVERGGKLESVTVETPDGTFTSPDLTPRELELGLDYITKFLGKDLPPAEIVDSLERTMFAATLDGDRVHVKVPAFRGDILHPIDIVEDVAIGHGFENFEGIPPEQPTMGTELAWQVDHGRAAESLVGLGLLEVTTLTLSNERDQFQRTGWPELDHVELANPITEDHTLVRSYMLPSLMQLLQRNRHNDLPHRLFELGEVVIGTDNYKKLSWVVAHQKANFSEARGLTDHLTRDLRWTTELRVPDNDGPFIAGRTAEIIRDGTAVGQFGEVHPAYLEAYNLLTPVIAAEMYLEDPPA